MSRIEEYLINCCEMCGCEGLPTPISNTDKLLYHLASVLEGGGGGGGGGDLPICVVTMKSVDESTGASTMSHTGEEVQDLVWGGKIVFANALGLPFIATGYIHEINGIPNAEFAYFLDPNLKALLDENGVFTPIEEE